MIMPNKLSLNVTQTVRDTDRKQAASVGWDSKVLT